MNNLFINKINSALIVSVALLAASCTDFDNGWEQKRIEFVNSFENEFGNIDPNHTWNTAAQGVISVDVPEGKNYTVKMYTANPRYSDKKAYMIGEFKNVDGGKLMTFNVDMPSNLEYVYVGLIDKNGDRIILPAKLGEDKKASVEFPSIGATKTRTALTGTTGLVTVSEASTKYEFGFNDILPVLETLPEKHNNVGNVSQNLCYISMGSFTLYPMYSVTGNDGKYSDGLVLGIYYYDENGNRQNVDVWKKSGTWLEVEKDNGNGKSWVGSTFFTSDEFKFPTGEVQGVPTGFVDGVDKMRSTGITIDIPKGTKFGFYIGASGVGGDKNLYSESAINKEVGHQSHDGYQCYAASFHNEGQLFLCFEDWYYTYTDADRDFNDIVFGFYGSTADPVIIDKDVATEEMQYMVACEDLGGTDDFDFNDVVFGIKHASGQDYAKIQLRAAGGTLPARIKYKGSEIPFTVKGQKKTEVHSVFGVDVSIMVNTGDFNADFVMSDAFSVDPNAFSIVKDAQDFAIEVTYEDGTKSVLQIPDESRKEKVPQAFLVANPEWIWPAERQNIKKAEDGFGVWVSNHLTHTWCDAVWGQVNEVKTIPANATNLLTTPSGTITYTTSNNEATVTIPKSCFEEDEAYELVVKPTAACNVSFNQGSETMTIMPNGKMQAGKVTTFKFNAAATNTIRGKNGDVVVTFTFANDIEASTKMEILYWSDSSASGDDPGPGGISYGTSLQVITTDVGGVKSQVVNVQRINTELGGDLSDDQELEFTIVLNEGVWQSYDFKGTTQLMAAPSNYTLILQTESFGGGTVNSFTVTYSQIKDFEEVGFPWISNIKEIWVRKK